MYGMHDGAHTNFTHDATVLHAGQTGDTRGALMQEACAIQKEAESLESVARDSNVLGKLPGAAEQFPTETIKEKLPGAAEQFPTETIKEQVG
jgi:hypothetical protein